MSTIDISIVDDPKVEITVEPDDSVTVEIVEGETTIITVDQGAQGPAGPPGPQGAAGPQGPAGALGGQYTHNQAVAAAIWTITHNLGFKPGGIKVFDTAGTQVEGDIEHLDVNTVRLTFSSGFSGTAYLS